MPPILGSKSGLPTRGRPHTKPAPISFSLRRALLGNPALKTRECHNRFDRRRIYVSDPLPVRSTSSGLSSPTVNALVMIPPRSSSLKPESCVIGN